MATFDYRTEAEIRQALWDWVKDPLNGKRHGNMGKLAKKAGVSKSTVSQILHGKNPVNEKLAAVVGYKRQVVFWRRRK